MMKHRTSIILTLAAAILAGCATQKKADPAAASSVTLPAIRKAPAFSYAAIDGRTVTEADLKGNISIVEFFFSTCKGPCPVMNSNASVLQSEFASLPNFRIISFTVDPDTDTPERLKEYAQRYGAVPGRWFFLRGEQNATGALSADGFLMGDEEDPMMHSTHFALIDTAGVIRGYYDATDAARVDSLRRDIRVLAGAKHG